ncbi:MAG TPA: lysylphosphatidylglycerol synthase transmembrane domain-containing protein, partial [Ilumatobacteraceae bacterium]
EPDLRNAADSEASTSRLRGRHLAAGVFAALAVGVLVVVGIGRLAGFAHLRDAVSGADYRWLAVCAAGQTAVFAGYSGALRNAIAVGDGARVPVTTSIRLVLASFAATQVFAFGGVAGLALVYWALRRVGMQREQAAVRLIGLATAVYLMFGLLACSAAALSLFDTSTPLAMKLSWLIAFPIVLLLARWFTTPSRMSRWVGGDGGWFRRALGTGISAAAWVRGLTTNDRGQVLLGWAALYWVGDIASLWAALHAFGVRPALAPLALVYATGYLAQSLPIPFIATGGVDAATTFLLHVIGIPLDVALAGVIAHRLFAFWLPVIPGSIFAVTLPRLGVALERST